MDLIIKRCGRFALHQTSAGYCWELTGRSGEQWFWHPASHLWTPSCDPSPTQEAASAGLDWTLNHEEAGDLNEQPHVGVGPRHHW